MPHRLITEQSEFEALCEEIRVAGRVGFDTEFLSEFTYRPELCLLQFATPSQCVAVDPYAVQDLSSWWQVMSGGEVLVVVHGGREEARFCLRNAGARPGKYYDVQIAEGLQARGFPLSYSSLVDRVLSRKTHGKETRTDWRTRPLSERQIAYALEDVAHLLEIHARQSKSLESRGRLHWAEAECARFIDELEQEPQRENWRKLPGVQSLHPRELAVVREVYFWREQEAAQRNKPVRKVLRDDLVIELGRRQPADLQDLMATRDMNRSDYRRAAEGMLAAIRRGREVPEHELPRRKRNDKEHDEHILAQLLSIALANRCAQVNIAMGLIGTTADLKHLVRWQVYGDREGGPPRLSQGWRAEVCGDLLTDVLAGRVSLRVADPQSDHPLLFEYRDPLSPGAPAV